MQKKVLVPLAEGFEMVEALGVVDVFRRGGVKVDLAAVGDSLQVTSSHNVVVSAEMFLLDCLQNEYDLVVLPGGIPGAENLRNSSVLAEILKKQAAGNKLYGAICASPALVLDHHGLIDGRQATCHPLFEEKLGDNAGLGKAVVVDNNCVTSRGAGTTIEFGLELLSLLLGEEKKKEVAKGMACDL